MASNVAVSLRVCFGPHGETRGTLVDCQNVKFPKVFVFTLTYCMDSYGNSKEQPAEEERMYFVPFNRSFLIPHDNKIVVTIKNEDTQLAYVISSNLCIIRSLKCNNCRAFDWLLDSESSQQMMDSKKWKETKFPFNWCAECVHFPFTCSCTEAPQLVKQDLLCHIYCNTFSENVFLWTSVSQDIQEAVFTSEVSCLSSCHSLNDLTDKVRSISHHLYTPTKTWYTMYKYWLLSESNLFYQNANKRELTIKRNAFFLYLMIIFKVDQNIYATGGGNVSRKRKELIERLHKICFSHLQTANCCVFNHCHRADFLPYIPLVFLLSVAKHGSGVLICPSHCMTVVHRKVILSSWKLLCESPLLLEKKGCINATSFLSTTSGLDLFRLKRKLLRIIITSNAVHMLQACSDSIQHLLDPSSVGIDTTVEFISFAYTNNSVFGIYLFAFFVKQVSLLCLCSLVQTLGHYFPHGIDLLFPLLDTTSCMHLLQVCTNVPTMKHLLLTHCSPDTSFTSDANGERIFVNEYLSRLK